jgi:CDP-diacylglycerol--glycerol-3-phosphate 3-phosphatidyltransferase
VAAAPPPPDREGYFDGWAALHGGYDPRSNVLVRRWLGIAYVVARPLAAARIPPDVVTVCGVVASAGVFVFAGLDGGLLLLAAALAVLAGLLDSLDGAVAVLRGRVSGYGTVLDSTCDRVSDLLLVAALWAAGAPALACVLGGALMLVQEYVRSSAAAAGMRQVGVVTVWERPTRVIVTAAFLVATAVVGEVWAELGAWVWVGLGVVGVVQLSVVVRRRLT